MKYTYVSYYLLMHAITTQCFFESYTIAQRYKEGDFSGAQVLLDHKIVNDVKNPELLCNAGDIAYRKKEFSQAEAYFQEACRLSKAEDNLYEKAHFNLGNVYIQDKQFQKAIDQYDCVLQKHPEDEKAFYNKKKAEGLLKEEERSKRDNPAGDKQKEKQEDQKKNQQKNKEKEQQKDSQEQEKEKQKEEQQTQKDGDKADNKSNQDGNDKNDQGDNQAGKNASDKSDKSGDQKETRDQHNNPDKNNKNNDTSDSNKQDGQSKNQQEEQNKNNEKQNGNGSDQNKQAGDGQQKNDGGKQEDQGQSEQQQNNQNGANGDGEQKSQQQNLKKQQPLFAQEDQENEEDLKEDVTGEAAFLKRIEQDDKDSGKYLFKRMTKVATNEGQRNW